MASIPVLQDRFIPQVSSKASNVGLAQSASNLLFTSAQVGMKYKQAKDATKVTEEYSRFQVDMQNAEEELKNTIGNSSDYKKQWNSLYEEKKQQYLDNDSLSGNARGLLEQSFTQYRVKNSLNVDTTQRGLEVQEYSNSVEETARNNNLVAYRAGENLDIDLLKNAETSVKANVIAGSTLVSRDKLEKLARIQTENLYANYIKGVAGTDIEQARSLIGNEDIQNKLGSVEAIDEMKSYIRQVENRKNSLEKDMKTSDSSLKKAALDIEVQTSLESEFQRFNIGQEGGQDVIKNKDLNNVDDLISFRESVKSAYANYEITDAQYKGYISKTNAVFTGMIERDELGEGGLPFFTSVNEQLTKDIKAQFKDNSDLQDSEFVGIYEDTIKQLKQENITLNSNVIDDKLRAQELFQENTQKYMQLKTQRSDAQSAIVGNKIYPLNPEAKTTGVKLDNGGWKTEEQDGVLYEIRRDSNGNVLEWRNK